MTAKNWGEIIREKQSITIFLQKLRRRSLPRPATRRSKSCLTARWSTRRWRRRWTASSSCIWCTRCPTLKAPSTGCSTRSWIGICVTRPVATITAAYVRCRWRAQSSRMDQVRRAAWRRCGRICSTSAANWSRPASTRVTPFWRCRRSEHDRGSSPGELPVPWRISDQAWQADAAVVACLEFGALSCGCRGKIWLLYR